MLIHLSWLTLEGNPGFLISYFPFTLTSTPGQWLWGGFGPQKTRDPEQDSTSSLVSAILGPLGKASSFPLLSLNWLQPQPLF